MRNGLKRYWLIVIGFMVFFLTSQVQAQMRVVSGSYEGNGTDNRSITGVGFQPDVVIIKGDTNKVAVCRTSTMIGDQTKPMVGSNALADNRIQSLDTDGFTIGTHGSVNSNNKDYYWVAFKAAAGEMVVSTYTGNSTGGNNNDNRSITGLGFSPDYVIIMSAGSNKAVHRSSAIPEISEDSSHAFDNTSGVQNRIQKILPDGFEVGTHNSVNNNGTTYHFIAWNEVAGKIDVGKYEGDNSDDRNITGIGFQPEYVIIKNHTGGKAVHHPESLGAETDSTLYFSGDENFDDGIQALISDGFQVGEDNTVNNNNKDYFWVAFKESFPTAVTLAFFTAETEEEGAVVLNWETATEINNAGFNIYRARLKDGNYKKINAELIDPKGSEVSGSNYTYTDTPPASGTYYYKLEDVEYGGVATMHGPVKVRVK